MPYVTNVSYTLAQRTKERDEIICILVIYRRAKDFADHKQPRTNLPRFSSIGGKDICTKTCRSSPTTGPLHADHPSSILSSHFLLYRVLNSSKRLSEIRDLKHDSKLSWFRLPWCSTAVVDPLHSSSHPKRPHRGVNHIIFVVDVI